MNVIVIVADSFRQDHCGCYGEARAKTPNLDAFAQKSAVFKNLWHGNLPTPQCRTEWFTGQYHIHDRGWQGLDPKDITLAEILWDKQMRSCLISDTYHLHKRGMAYERGFDETIWIRGQEADRYITDEIEVNLEPYCLNVPDDKRNEFNKWMNTQYLRNRKDWKKEEDYLCPQVILTGIEWLKRQKKKDNLFLWIDNFSPHEPWDPPKPYNRMYQPDYEGIDLIMPFSGDSSCYTEEQINNVRALYAGFVTFVDKWMGALFEEMDKMKLFENSLVIFMSDHGEPLNERGYLRKARPFLYEELTSVPFFIRLPDGTGAGKKYDQITQSVDLAPTILDFLGKKPDTTYHLKGTLFHEKAHLDGESLLPIIRGEKEKIRDFAYMGYSLAARGIKAPEYNYFHTYKGAPKLRRGLLFNRINDPEENHNLADKQPDKVLEFRDLLDEFFGHLTTRMLNNKVKM